MGPRKGMFRASKDGFSSCGMWDVGCEMGPSDDKWLNVKRLQKCARRAYLGANPGVIGKTM